MSDRDMLRKEAMKVYKDMIKKSKVQKKNRKPFADFFKEYKKLKAQEKIKSNITEENKEDFDFDNIVNINNEMELDNGGSNV